MAVFKRDCLGHTFTLKETGGRQRWTDINGQQEDLDVYRAGGYGPEDYDFFEAGSFDEPVLMEERRAWDILWATDVDSGDQKKLPPEDCVDKCFSALDAAAAFRRANRLDYYRPDRSLTSPKTQAVLAVLEL